MTTTSLKPRPLIQLGVMAAYLSSLLFVECYDHSFGPHQSATEWTGAYNLFGMLFAMAGAAGHLSLIVATRRLAISDLFMFLIGALMVMISLGVS